MAGSIEMVALLYLGNFYIISGYLITRLSRRKGIAGLNLVSLIIGLMFLFPFVRENKIVSTVLLGLGRFAGSKTLNNKATAYTMVACLQVEAFTV